MHAGIYIHFPFCVKKCNYCDFYSLPLERNLRDRYMEALLTEIENSSYQGTIDTIYIGGGTPSLLDPADVEGILQNLSGRFELSRNTEVSLEVNPGTVNRWKMREFKRAGVNRVSIGIQSIADRHLKTLGRIHGAEDALGCLVWASEFFENFSVDILYGISGQKVRDLNDDICKLHQYRPPHISAYELSLEDGTPLSSMISQGIMALPSEDEKVAMYESVVDSLSRSGYIHYEISNYSLPDYECRHNMKYWTRGEYLGFGASAHSFLKERRSKNVSHILSYISGIESRGSAKEGETILTNMEKRREEIFLGLRTMYGIDSRMLHGTLPLLDSLEKHGLIHSGKDSIALTHKGMLLSNKIIVELLEELEGQRKVEPF
jgi:oxygen-independent coproporphyrinogen-3 oxidase